MKPAPTLRLVASRCGLSLAATSMALRRHPNIPKATQRKVEKAAAQMGYQADPKISELMRYMRSSRSRPWKETLGYLSCFPRGAEPLWQRQYLEGASAHAEKLGYQIDHLWIQEPGLTPSRIDGILRQRAIRGLLVAPFGRAGSVLELDWERYATVAFGYTMASPNVHRVLNHHFNTMLLAVRTLAASGYRRIGLAMEPINDETVNHLWKAGYLIGQEAMAPKDRLEPHIEPFEKDRFVDWFRAGRIDALIANEAKYYSALVQAGLRCPADFAIATLTYAQEAPQRLARVDQNYRQQGVEAVNLLLSNLIHNNLGLPEFPQLLMVEGRWKAGETVRTRKPEAIRKARRGS